LIGVFAKALCTTTRFHTPDLQYFLGSLLMNDLFAWSSPVAAAFRTTLVAAWLVSFACSATAQEPLREQKERLADFLREHVMERTLVDEGEATIAESRLKVRYRTRLTFTGLAETSNGFSFREVGVVQKTKFDIDDEGQVVSEGINRDVAGVTEFHFAKRRSSDRVIGTVSNLEATSGGRPVGVDAIPRISLADGKLTMHRRGVLYDDYFSEGDTWRAGSADSVHEFWVEEGRLNLKVTSTYYDVDVETLERTPTGDTMTLHYRELSSPETRTGG